MEHRTGPDASPFQEEVLRKYCDEAEVLLKGSGSREEALRIRDEVCARLRMECESTMIFQGAREYLTGIIQSTWSQDSDNPADHQH